MNYLILLTVFSRRSGLFVLVELVLLMILYILRLSTIFGAEPLEGHMELYGPIGCIELSVRFVLQKHIGRFCLKEPIESHDLREPIVFGLHLNITYPSGSIPVVYHVYHL